MNLVESEIRDYLQTNLVTTATAGAGTTTTNIYIAAHGLNVGDNIINTTRSSGLVAITAVVDANNVTVPAITNQVPGDTITVPMFKRYICGKFPNDTPPDVNDLPLVTIKATKMKLFARAVQADKYAMDVVITAYTNAYDFVANADLSNDILAAQLDMDKKMCGRDPSTYKLSLTSILGCLSHKIANWNSFLFHDSYEIDTGSGLLKGKYFYKSTLALRCVTSFIPSP